MVLLNDYLLIKELTGLDQKARLFKLNELGDRAAADLRDVLPRALVRFPHVLLLTPVPPHSKKPVGTMVVFPVTAGFRISAAGPLDKRLLSSLCPYPNCEVTVLCGHTQAVVLMYQFLPNLNVKTGGAEYGSPAVQEILKTPQWEGKDGLSFMT